MFRISGVVTKLPHLIEELFALAIRLSSTDAKFFSE
jgi:hypothetical protein